MIHNVYISDYKCFEGFELPESLGFLNAVYGRNGSGKTSIVELLKEYNEGNCQTELEVVPADPEWVPHMHFFDSKYVNRNVHTHGKRANSKAEGAHQQNSGQLIISLDERAIKLEEAVKEKEAELQKFQADNQEALIKPTSEEEEFFIVYKEHDEEDRRREIAKLKEEIAENNKEKEKLEKRDSVHDRINTIEFLKTRPPTKIEIEFPEMPDAEEIEQWIEYQDPTESTDDDICPVCGSEFDCNALTENQIKQIRRVMAENSKEREVFDKVWGIVHAVSSLPSLVEHQATALFNRLELLNQHVRDDKFYHVSMKEDVLNKIAGLKGKTDSLTSNSDILENLEEITRATKTTVNSLNVTVTRRANTVRKLVDELENETEESVEADIEAINGEIALQEAALAFLSLRFESMVKTEEVMERQEDLKRDVKKAEKSLKDYLSTTIPNKIVGQMNKTFKEFKAPFHLNQVPARGGTKNYSFAFAVVDNETEEVRTMENGLSAGERQLVSLAFFFATLSLVENKKDAVLVFDDPMTDLDEFRTRVLGGYIDEQSQEFGQVIVFTHNPYLYESLPADVKQELKGGK